MRTELLDFLRAELQSIHSAHESPWIADALLKSLKFDLGKSEPEADLKQNLFAKAREIVERRKNHEPLAYILGSWAFRHYEFFCGPGVLIPRPESEELVEAALMTLENSHKSSERLFDKGLRVVDAGAGTGCIGLSLIADLLNDIETEGVASGELSKKFSLTLIERSPEARRYLDKNVEVMRANLKHTKVEVFGGSWRDWSPTACDLFISNPPYVTRSQYDECEPSVKNFEPKEALLPDDINERAGAEGAYAELIEIAHSCLVPEGWLWFELGTTQHEWIHEHVSQRGGFNDIRVLKDIAKKPRFFCAKKA